MTPPDMPVRYFALIAHDAKKGIMVEFVERHRAFLQGQRLLGTRTTGTLVQSRTGLPVTTLLSGPLGGDLQIGALVATGEVRAVVFLRDPLTAHPHEPDIAALMKVCDIYDVPLATNMASAHVLVEHLDRSDRSS